MKTRAVLIGAAAFVLFLVTGSVAAQNAHTSPSKASAGPLTLTPAFKLAAETALDAIDSAGWAGESPGEAVFATQFANARNEIDRARRQVRTRQDAIAALKLRRVFEVVESCRRERGQGEDAYTRCLDQRGDPYNDAAISIGAKTWKTVEKIAGTADQR